MAHLVCSLGREIAELLPFPFLVISSFNVAFFFGNVCMYFIVCYMYR